jgi:ABC-type Fe3+/spermidine/putrescine transport system ATPase subunit
MEALTISDRIAVMAAGRIEQFATPYEVYDHPTTGYVADFIGAANVFSFSDAQRWGYKPDIQAVNADTIVVRPENLFVYVAPDGPDTPTINFARLTGPGVEYEIGLGDGRVVRALVDRMDHEPIQVGAPVELAIRKSELCQPISSDNEQFASTNRAQS